MASQSFQATSGCRSHVAGVSLGKTTGREVPARGSAIQCSPDTFYDVQKGLDALRTVPGSHGRERDFRALPTRSRQRNGSRMSVEVGPRGTGTMGPGFERGSETTPGPGAYTRSGTPPRVFQHPLLQSRRDMDWAW